MATWATIPSHMQLSCDSFTVGTNFGGGRSGANAKLRTGITLDVTKAGIPIGQLSDGIEIDGLSLKIGDLIELNSTTCSNYPALLDDYPNNLQYPNRGFVGYVTNISIRADTGLSVIDISLGDEIWKWSQYAMYPIAFNINDATKMLSFNEIRQNGYTTMEIVSYLEELLDRQGHSKSEFSVSRTGFADRVADPKVTSFTSGTIFQAFEELISNVFGSAVQIYSGGAGDIQLRRVATDENTLAGITIDKNKIISNNIEVKSSDKKVDVVLAFGDRCKYYLGDGKIDNELVPDWDWWMDGYFIVIDIASGQPAMFVPKDQTGFVHVNPFNMACVVNSNGTVQYVDPTDPPPNAVTFVYGDGSIADNEYPSYIRYLNVFRTSQISQYVFVRSYAMDAILSEMENILRPIHDFRFKRWRLKDAQPKTLMENVHTSPYSIGTSSDYYDNQFFPRRIGRNGVVKDYNGDPANLNTNGARVYINRAGGNETYKALISPQFINSSTHKIVQERLKPGVLLDGSSGENEDLYESIPNPNMQGQDLEDPNIATQPIFVKYDLVNNAAARGNNGMLQAVTNNVTFSAERVQAEGGVNQANTAYQTNRISILTTSNFDSSGFKVENPDATSNTIGGFFDSWRPNAGLETDSTYEIESFFSPFMLDSNGEVIGEGGQKLRWFYPMRHGRVIAIDWVKRQNHAPIYDSQMKIVNYHQVNSPIGFPRIEMFGFVMYEDRPELEPKSVLANLGSYYWTYVRSALKYSRTNASPNENTLVISGENALFERQLGGYYDYDTDVVLGDEYERIAFYRTTDLGISSVHGIANTTVNLAGNHMVVLKVPLFNATYRFNQLARDFVHGRIPSGRVQYYERHDISPELNGQNIGVYSVTHNIENGWTVDVTYGGGIPRLRDMFDRQERIEGIMRSVLVTQSANKTISLIGVDRYRRREKG